MWNVVQASLRIWNNQGLSGGNLTWEKSVQGMLSAHLTMLTLTSSSWAASGIQTAVTQAKQAVTCKGKDFLECLNIYSEVSLPVFPLVLQTSLARLAEMADTQRHGWRAGRTERPCVGLCSSNTVNRKTQEARRLFQCVKYMLCKHESLSLDPQYTHKKCICTPDNWVRDGDTWILVRADQPISLKPQALGSVRDTTLK